MQGRALKRLSAILALAPFPFVAHAECPAALKQFLDGVAVAGYTCVHSDDLRTNNPATTPPDNFILTFADGTPLPGLLGGLFGIVPTTDRTVISNGPAPTSTAVPGIQVQGWFAADPTKQARFLLRFPDDWNGKLVVAGSSGTRSEFNRDWAWSDPGASQQRPARQRFPPWNHHGFLSCFPVVAAAA